MRGDDFGQRDTRAVVARTAVTPTSHDIVRDFIHTVLVVDDRAEIVVRAKPTAATAVAKEDGGEPEAGPRPRAPIGELREPEQLTVDDYDASKELDALALTAAFATEGLVCGVLCPTGPNDLHEATVKTASRSDVVVLDWSFETDNGETALSIIKDIIAGDEPDRLRFVAIYTGESALPPIADRIFEDLSKLDPTRAPQRLDDHVVERGPLRIAVFGKPSPRNIPGAVEDKRRFTVQELPGALISEYGRLHKGLLATAALAGVAAIRRKTDLLLAKFRPELDAGYLWHRAVLPDPDDAEQQFVDVLVAEIGAVIEDAAVSALVDAAHCVDLIRGRGVDSMKGAFGNADHTAPIEAYEALFSNGIKKTPQSGVHFKSLQDRPAREEQPSFCSSPPDMTRANDQFAMLMTLRTRYTDDRALSIGTIVRLADSDKYFLCVLPACDTVRLKDPRSFAFAPLLAITDVAKRFSLVAPSDAENAAHLAASYQMYDLTMIPFQPDATGRVGAKLAIDGRYVFEAVDKSVYTWIADLKPFKAQAEALKVSGQMSRPGVDDPEWLRAAEKR